MMWGQFMFQDANSFIMEMMIFFYDYVMLMIMMIITLIFYMMIYLKMNLFKNRFLFNGQMIEVIWTLIPMIVLLFLSVPSLKLLYMTDELDNPLISIKIIGHQWYWSYEYNDLGKISYDSFMIKDSLFRLIEVDNNLIIPVNLQIRLLISSEDVIHSFALPSMGIKVDAVPGRINQIGLLMNRVGKFYGQCSEICGVNHSFMPIVLESTSLSNYLNWIYNSL